MRRKTRKRVIVGSFIVLLAASGLLGFFLLSHPHTKPVPLTFAKYNVYGYARDGGVFKGAVIMYGGGNYTVVKFMRLTYDPRKNLLTGTGVFAVTTKALPVTAPPVGNATVTYSGGILIVDLGNRSISLGSYRNASEAFWLGFPVNTFEDAFYTARGWEPAEVYYTSNGETFKTSAQLLVLPHDYFVNSVLARYRFPTDATYLLYRMTRGNVVYWGKFVVIENGVVLFSVEMNPLTYIYTPNTTSKS